jgi:hypothetical protein
MGSLFFKGGLDQDAIATKLLCFGADGVSAFQGKRTGVTVQIKKKFAPFSTGVHYHAHKINLAVKTLSQLSIFHSIEEVMRVAYSYFSHSPKKFDEYKSWASTIDTKALKLLKNVTTRWLSLLEPMRRLQSEYRTILGKMETDNSNKKENVSFGSLSSSLVIYLKVFSSSLMYTFLCNSFLFIFWWSMQKAMRAKAKRVLDDLLDPYLALGMTALMPLLDCVNSLVKFAQSRHVYICDFIGALTSCQGQLYVMYKDSEKAFKTRTTSSISNSCLNIGMSKSM